MFKKFFSKKDNKGYISIEAIIVAALILSLASFLLFRWAFKSNNLNDKVMDGMQDNLGKIEDPSGNGDNWFDKDNNGDNLLGDSKILTKTFELEKSLNKDQTTVITLENLNKIKSISTINGGQVEIISIEGDNVTIRVHSGTPSESIVVRGEYTPYDEKIVTAQDNPFYNIDGYTGTLTAYVYSGEESTSKLITDTKTSSSNNFSDTIEYNKAGYTGTLTKKENPIQTLISGSPASSKTVTAQSKSYYSDSDGFTGTLYSYVYSGSAPLSKTVTDQPTVSYYDGIYSGTLTQYLHSGAPGDSKYITNQTSQYYNDGVYSGTLTQYVYSGSYTQAEYKTFEAVPFEYGGDEQNLGYYSSPDLIPRTVKVEKHHRIFDAPGRIMVSGYEGTMTYVEAQLHYGRYYGRFTGTLYKAPQDTRVYRYQGTVNSADTRIYRYKGTVYTPDTRIYRYQGTVSKPDTRVYGYTQAYTGTVTSPDTRVYKYQGIVARPESDTREYEHYYQYDVNVKYYELKK